MILLNNYNNPLKYYATFSTEKKDEEFSFSDDNFIKLIVGNLEKYKSFRILKANIFLNCVDFDSFNNAKSKINNMFGNIFTNIDFPILFIPQQPANLSSLSIEICYLNPEIHEFKYNYVKNKCSEYCILKIDDKHEIYGNVSDLNQLNNVYQNSETCFLNMTTILSENEFELNHLIRQWMYIGNINKYNELDGISMENYQMFNACRAKYYDKTEWKFGYPAATGIGMAIDGAIIEFIAVKQTNDYEIIPLVNPNQIDAHRYSGKYIPIKTEVNSPKFERGKILKINKFVDVYISGTAAIIGEDSVTKNAAQQTLTTIDNIAKLISSDNLENHGILTDFTIDDISHIRAYIKNYDDYLEVAEICQKYFKNIPITYTIADICRDELLVEIEATANLKV